MTGPIPQPQPGPRANFLQRLAGSKLVTTAGLLFGAIATACLAMPMEIEALAPDWGRRICAGVALASFLASSFGKALADQRNGTPEPGEITSARYIMGREPGIPVTGDRRKR